MFNTLSSWWRPEKISSTITTVQTVENSLATHIQDNINLKAMPEPVLWKLKQQLQQTKISKDHPLLSEIDKRLSNKAFSILLRSNFSLQQVSIVQSGLAERTYIQKPYATLEETKKELEGLIGKLDSIQLCDVNDDLMIFIAQNFRQLKSFKIEDTGCLEFFTIKGLRSIASLENLELLTIDSWSGFPDVTKDDLTSFFSTPSFVSRLKELKIVLFLLFDETVSILAQYRSLRTLNLSAGLLKEEGLSNLFQSKFLKNNLTNLAIHNSSPGVLTDNTLSKLKDFSNLEYLSLGEGVFTTYWGVSDSVLMEILNAQKKLKKLNLECGTINGPIAEKIGQMQQLEYLQLVDCSKIPSKKEWELLFSNMEKLTSLKIQNTNTLDEDSILSVGKLSLTFLSIITSHTWGGGYVSPKWMQNLCNSDTLKTHLKTLHLTQLAETKSEDWKLLQNFKNLTSLRLNRCPWFNGDSINSLLPLSKTLQTIELVSTSIDDQAISTLSQFINLKNLFLGNSYALNKRAFDLLINNPFFQDNLEVFGTEQDDWTSDQLNALSKFKKIKTLILFNSPLKENRALVDLAKEKGFTLYISSDITYCLEQFEKAIR